MYLKLDGEKAGGVGRGYVDVEMVERELLPSAPIVSVLPSSSSSSLNELLQHQDILTNPDSVNQILESSQRFCNVPSVVKRSYGPKQYTRICCISDTHGKHCQV